MLGKIAKCDNSRLMNVLRVEPIPINKTIIDMGHSLIERNMVQKK